MIYEKRIKTITLKLKEPAPQNKVSSAEEVFHLARSIYAGLDDDQEHFTIFFLDSQNKVRGFKTVFSGGQNSSGMDMKVIFRNALIFGALSIICVHNHPSGNIQASSEDGAFTRKLKEAGELLEIKLLDHLIISQTKYYSFANDGLV